jgi:NitT/TauT family transport system substrate-binding protein
MKFQPLKRHILLGLALASAISSGHVFAQAKPLITVNAGFVPVTDVAALYLGEEVGIFKKQGLTLKANIASTGAVPAVMSG